MKAKLVVEGKEFDIEINDPELQKLVAPKKKTGYERVSDGYAYYFANSVNDIIAMNDEGDDDNIRYKDANYYSSAAVAENNARADKLMRKLRRFAVEHRENELCWNWKSHKWYVVYNYDEENFEVEREATWKTFGCIYFDTKELAELAIKAYHDELIWYFTEYKDSL